MNTQQYWSDYKQFIACSKLNARESKKRFKYLSFPAMTAKCKALVPRPALQIVKSTLPEDIKALIVPGSL
jgi:hypothetical protein